MKISRIFRYIQPALCCAVLALDIGETMASYLTVYGGPEYDGRTATGLRYQTMPWGEMVNDNGMAVGGASKYISGTSYGLRAFRWDGSGANAVELGDLGTTNDGYTDNYAWDINNSGTAVGQAREYGSVGFVTRAVRWDISGAAATELGHLGTSPNGNTISSAHAVNNGGTIVGTASKWIPGTFTSLGVRAVRWDPGSTAATELGNLGTSNAGDTFCEPFDVNESGTIVGRAKSYLSGSDKGFRAVRWNAAGTATQLGDLGTSTTGITDSYARDVNNLGTAVGSAKKYIAGSDKGLRAVRWDATGSTATELGNLGTRNDGFAESFAYQVNDSGIAVGTADKYESGLFRGTRAVRWDPSGTVTELGNLGIDTTFNTTRTFAYDLNSNGIAVGDAQKPGLGSHAVLWKLDGVAIDLNTLIDPASGWLLISAQGISNTGWIAGVGTFDADGTGGQAPYDRVFLLQIPEPAGVFLGVTACAFGFACRRTRSVQRYARPNRRNVVLESPPLASATSRES